MDRVKILHFSDLHFDTPFKDLPGDLGQIRRLELRECFSKIVDLAIKEKIEILLMAGDLFDNLTVEKNTLTFIQREIQRLGNIKIFIAAGNHDPYNEKSFYKMIEWGKNVHIFKENIEEINIPELNVVVYGASFKDKYIRTSQLKDFSIPSNNSDKINLMVLHGTISSVQEGEEYNPLTLDSIAKSKVDYLALGHIHGFSGINRVHNTYYAYSGCPEGRGFDELGEKGVILGEVGKHYVDLKFIPLSKRKYFVEEVDITECFTIEDIKTNIIKCIDKKDSLENLYKIVLKGELNEEIKVSEKLLERMLKANFFFIKVEDRTSLKVNKEKLKNEFSLKGVFCSKILDEIKMCSNDSEKEDLELAFKIGMQSLCQGEVNLDDY